MVRTKSRGFRAMSRPGEAVVVLALVAAMAALGGGVAAGHGNGKPKKPSGYRTKGTSNVYATQKQVCFVATWRGDGGHSYDYHEKFTDPETGETTSQTNNDSSNYSWDASEVRSGAGCNVQLIGSSVFAGAAFNRGFLRLALSGHDVYPTNSGPMTVTCDEARITHASNTQATGGYTVQRRGDSLVFVATVAIGEPPKVPYNCAVNASPYGTGAHGDFLTSSSVAVPIAVFEHARQVLITISNDPKHGFKPNCGYELHPNGDTRQTISCTEKGAWQSTLTLTQYHG